MNFPVSEFEQNMRKNFVHWVRLHPNPLDDEFKGKMGRDEKQTPRVKISYEISLKSEERPKRKKKTKETISSDQGEDDSSQRKMLRDPGNQGLLKIKKLMQITTGESKGVNLEHF